MFATASSTFIGLFSGVGGAGLLALINWGPRWGKTVLENRRIRKTSFADIVRDVELLKAQQAVTESGLARVVQFIEGTPDPYLKNNDGTPKVTGGLLDFMSRIGKRFDPPDPPRPNERRRRAVGRHPDDSEDDEEG